VLSGIIIGSLSLTPEFSADTTSYAAATTNEEDAVSAEAASGVSATILVNGISHSSGDNATWESGVNTVTASKKVCASTSYTVTVTKKGLG